MGFARASARAQAALAILAVVWLDAARLVLPSVSDVGWTHSAPASARGRAVRLWWAVLAVVWSVAARRVGWIASKPEPHVPTSIDACCSAS